MVVIVFRSPVLLLIVRDTVVFCYPTTNIAHPAGQLGLDAKSMQFVDGGVQEQARRALENMGKM